MAAVTMGSGPTTVETVGYPATTRGIPVKLSWGALFGGMFVAMGAGILLMALGLAIGLSSVDPNNPISAKHAGIGTGIWSLIVPIIALFFGGVVASRAAGMLDRGTAAVHGAVLWGLTTLIGVLAIGWTVKTVAVGAVNMTSDVLGAAGQAGVTAVEGGGNVAQSIGIDTNEVLRPLNERLQAEGKPTIAPQQLEAATRDTLSTAVREGRLDREVLVGAITRNTRLSRTDAQDLANRFETSFNQRKDALGQRVQGAKQDIQRTGLEAADTTGKGMWWVVLGLVLGLGASVLGSSIGVTRRQRVAAGERVPVGPTHTQEVVHT